MQKLGIAGSLNPKPLNPACSVAIKYAKASDSGESIKGLVDTTVQKAMDEDEQEGRITGLLLLLPGAALMIVEGPQRLVIGSLKTIHVISPNHKIRYPTPPPRIHGSFGAEAGCRLIDSHAPKSQTQNKKLDAVASIHMLSSIQDAPGRSFPLWGSRALQVIPRL